MTDPPTPAVAAPLSKPRCSCRPGAYAPEVIKALCELAVYQRGEVTGTAILTDPARAAIELDG